MNGHKRPSRRDILHLIEQYNSLHLDDPIHHDPLTQSKQKDIHIINKADETEHIRCVDNFARFLWDSKQYCAKRDGEGSIYPWQKLIDSTKDFLEMVEKEMAEAEQPEKQGFPQRLFNDLKRKLSDLSLPGRKKSPSPQREMSESAQKESSAHGSGQKPADSHRKNHYPHHYKLAKQPSPEKKHGSNNHDRAKDKNDTHHHKKNQEKEARSPPWQHKEHVHRPMFEPSPKSEMIIVAQRRKDQAMLHIQTQPEKTENKRQPSPSAEKDSHAQIGAPTRTKGAVLAPRPGPARKPSALPSPVPSPKPSPKPSPVAAPERKPSPPAPARSPKLRVDAVAKEVDPKAAKRKQAQMDAFLDAQKLASEVGKFD